MPCCRRASAVTGAADQAEALVAGEGDAEDWVAPERTGGAGPSADGNQDDGIPTLGEDAAGKADVRVEAEAQCSHNSPTVAYLVLRLKQSNVEPTVASSATPQWRLKLAGRR